MKISRNRMTVAAIALFLVLTVAVTLVALPTANAHTPPWTYQSYAYIVPAPNPVGVGQRVLIVMWVDYPLVGATVTNNIRRHDYKLTITKPDKTTETMNWPIVTDTTSIQYTTYTPDQVGNYTLKFDYPGETYTWSGAYQNDTYSACSKTVTLTVTQEQLPLAKTSYPLPTEYWTRPIEGQNTDWWKISSNWLRGPYIKNRFQPNGLGPNSAHVMWSKPIEEGGVVGGSNVGVEGNTFYMGGSYNVRWSAPIIMYGRLYYELPYGNSGSGGGYVCVDLRTGEQLWWTNTTGIGVPSFGYYYDYNDGNQHGVLPQGLLFTYNFARAYQPSTGRVTATNITNVPTGAEDVGPHGEILRISVTNIGSITNPDWRITQWNFSKINQLTLGQIGAGNWFPGFFNASDRRMYDYNVSTTLGPGTWSITRVAYDNMVFLTQGNFGGRPGTYYGGDQYGANVTVISLKPESRGVVLWTKHFDAASGNVTRVFADWSPALGVWITEDKETLVHNGWSLTDGSHLWGPTPPANDYTYFRSTTVTGYGRLYFAGYGGVIYCYDIKNGSRLWTYGNGGPNAIGNSTFSGLETSWGSYPIFITAIADGKVYTASTEHSPGSPFYKDTRVRCVDAYTGKEIWTLMGWGTGMDATYDIVADGFYVFLNCYDMKVYCIGKGPSATTVEAPMTAITAGDNVVIRGTVTDIAAGTKQDEPAARFPNGVPAVSDASMSGWMEYVYMQKPRPANATGVEVTIDAIDPNGNFIHIGTATSDTSGLFSYAWKTPDVPGKYTIIATFAGSESYWPSYAETAAVVSEAPAVTPPVEQIVQLPPFDLYILAATVAIIIAIAIVGLMILRKRP